MNRKKVIIVTIVVLAVVSCHSVPDTVLNDEYAVECAGSGDYWDDTGNDGQFPISALWTRAIDSSWAELLVKPDSGFSNDTVYLQHTSQGWAYDKKDSRQQSGWDPYVTETNDSVIVGMGFGYSRTDYYLKKN
jgi:hypothetical protein